MLPDKTEHEVGMANAGGRKRADHGDTVPHRRTTAEDDAHSDAASDGDAAHADADSDANVDMSEQDAETDSKPTGDDGVIDSQFLPPSFVSKWRNMCV